MDKSDEVFLLVPIVCGGILIACLIMRNLIIPKVPQSFYDFLSPPHDDYHSDTETTTNAMHRVV